MLVLQDGKCNVFPQQSLNLFSEKQDWKIS